MSLSISPKSKIKQPTISLNSPIVLELFTSQGCSSCPPADRLLQHFKALDNPDVFVLSFHVDYWNHLGWKDPYSKHEFSLRQRAYAERLSSSIYTPQMVVNGKAHVVGSNKTQIESLMDREKASNKTNVLELKHIEKTPTRLNLAYLINGELNDQLNLNIAFVLSKKEQNIPRGENQGHKLVNHNIVDTFEVIPIEASKGEVMVAIPDHLKNEKYTIIAYTQNRFTMEINGAVKF